MYYAYKCRLKPSDSHREELDRHRDICRQLYNHALYHFNQIPEDTGTLNQRVRSIRDEIPSLKDWWDGLSDVYSTVLQTAVMRIEQNVKSLGGLKENGYGVGQLKWKPPREFRSFTYSQSGFKLDEKGGQTILSLSKLAEIPIRLHRPIPDDAKLKQVTVKKEPTGEWFATFGVEMDCEPPKPPENPEKCVGIDVGILNMPTIPTGWRSGRSISRTNVNA
jgi:putative transposase